MRQALWLFLALNAFVFGQDDIHRAFIYRDMSFLSKSQDLECRMVPMGRHLATEFFYDEDWHLYEWEADRVYLSLDNQSVANIDDITLDPFLVIRTKTSRKDSQLNIINSWARFASYDAIHPSTYVSKSMTMEKLTLPTIENKRLFKSQKPVKVINRLHVFSDCEPYFMIETDSKTCEEIHWQISDKPFENDHSRPLCANFEGHQEHASRISLDLLSATFINSSQMYYFRFKAKHEGNWTVWSDPFVFSVKKPQAVRDASFEIDPDFHEVIQWESDNPEGTLYYVFASNAMDFIPSIYFDKQINAIRDGEIIDAESNHNLLAVTADRSIRIDSSYAYYRVIAEKDGMFSVPSPLIRYFSNQMVLPRNVLQQIEPNFAKRIGFPEPYSQCATKDPLELVANKMFNVCSTPRPANVSSEIWENVKPYLIPDNHPVKEKLDRIFTKYRATHSVTSLEIAGFRDIKKGPWSHTTICKHNKLKGYFIKLFRDEQRGINDWQKLLMRATGSECVRASIERHKWGNIMKAPRKWLYPLPNDPPANPGTEGKNFVLIAEDMNVVRSKENKALWKNEITKKHLDAVFTLITEEGLSDTVQAFNMPFSFDGRISMIDLEHHHEWPIPYEILLRYLNSHNGEYWKQLIKHNRKP